VWRPTSQADPELSVVVGSTGAAGALERCLVALEGQLGGVEVIVCEPAPRPESLRERFPFVRWHVREGALVPELWRDGIRLTHGALVALTISPMTPAGDWVDSLRRALAANDAVGGAIEPAPGLGLVDGAEYLSRYGRDMLPFPPGASLDLAGDNAGYRRTRLEEVAGSWQDGFWEPEVHRALAARGAELRHDPTVVVHMGSSAGFRAFLRQRLVHGRAFGRGRGGSGAVNAARIARAAAVPVVLLARTARETFGRRRLRARLVISLPVLVAFDVAWAAGEALGHLDALRAR
jgi:hypothetical protein